MDYVCFLVVGNKNKFLNNITYTFYTDQPNNSISGVKGKCNCLAQAYLVLGDQCD